MQASLTMTPFYEISNIATPTLQMRKWRRREVNPRSQSFQALAARIKVKFCLTL